MDAREVERDPQWQGWGWGMRYRVPGYTPTGGQQAMSSEPTVEHPWPGKPHGGHTGLQRVKDDWSTLKGRGQSTVSHTGLLSLRWTTLASSLWLVEVGHYCPVCQGPGSRLLRGGGE
jgi:hypothetical protein